MGYPYDGLIPAAILYNNPGLSKEEFAVQLDKAEVVSSDYGGGLDAVARMLYLPPMDNYADLRYYDLELNSEFQYATRLTNWDWENRKIIVQQYNHRTLEEEEFTFVNFWPLNEHERLDPDIAFRYDESDDSPQIIDDDRFHDLFGKGCNFNEYNQVKITAILDQVGPHCHDDKLDGYQQQRIRVMPFRIYEQGQKTYDYLSDFFDDYPHVHPLQRFDWTPTEGQLKTDSHCPPLHWYRKENRYYLDETHARKVLKDIYFNKDDVRRYPGGSWVDLILTAEAVKQEFWKVLEYRGLQHLTEFFITHPEVVQIYNQARFDLDISSFAQKQKMTNIEFLRWRLEHGGNIHETDPEKIRAGILSEIALWQRYAAHDHEIGLDVHYRTDYTVDEIERFVRIATKRD